MTNTFSSSSSSNNEPLSIMKGKTMCAFHNQESEDNLWLETKTGYISICLDCVVKLIYEAHKTKYPDAWEGVNKEKRGRRYAIKY